MDRIEFISEYRPSHTYIFWDRPELERMSPREFVSYVDGLRQKGQSGRHELEQLIIRFVGIDALFKKWSKFCRGKMGSFWCAL